MEPASPLRPVAVAEPRDSPWVRAPGFVGRTAVRGVAEIGRMGVFLARAFAGMARRPVRPRLWLERLYFIGNRSVVLIILTASFTGMVLTLQSYNALSRFGSTVFVGSLVSLSLIKELGPVLAALMVTARAGSANTATIGNMRITEQIDALDSMAVDPIQYLVSPWLGASLVAVPLVTGLFSAAGILAGYLFGVGAIGLDGGVFMSSVRDSVEWSDVREGVIKSLVFAVIVAWVSCYRGFYCGRGALGVGRATARAVVEISVAVLVGDYVMTALIS